MPQNDDPFVSTGTPAPTRRAARKAQRQAARQSERQDARRAQRRQQSSSVGPEVTSSMKADFLGPALSENPLARAAFGVKGKIGNNPRGRR